MSSSGSTPDVAAAVPLAPPVPPVPPACIVGELLAAGEAAESTGDFAGAADAYARAHIAVLGIKPADASAEAAATAAHAETRFRMGRVAWRQGRFDVALAHYDAARAIAQGLEDVELLARIENGVGAVHYSRGAYAQARASYRVTLDITQRDSVRAKAYLNLGVIANVESDFEAARGFYARSRDAFRRAGDASGEALVLHNMGMLCSDLERWEEAEEAFDRCLTLSEALGNRQMIANVLINRSELLCARGRFDGAAAECSRALAIYTEAGDEVGRGEAMRLQGAAERRAGRYAAASRVLREAVRVAVRHQNVLLEAEATRELGALECDHGDPAAAVQWLERSHARFVTLGARREEEAVRAELERIATASARACTREASPPATGEA
ncbi:MAG TPA: tetratricopeptide repeat protein [Gemmatimonadaceae bacterium]|nr:tetratricopeptide repeat protein [Gemmatimonadaceae bacterium]